MKGRGLQMQVIHEQRQALRPLVVVFLCVCFFTSDADAQSFAFHMARDEGELNATIDINVPVVGTLIGNFDPETNPGGTKTRKTLFGNQNEPIPYTAMLVAATDEGGVETHPAGQFNMDIDIIGDHVYIANLFLDALNGAAPTLDATFNINYQTFYTSNPTEIFPGGFTIPISLGQIAITAMTMTQVGGTAVGTMTPLAGNQYAVEALVDVEINLEADFNGTPISPGAIQLTSLLSGTMTLIDAQNAQFAIDISETLSETETGPFEGLENVPLSIPGPLSGQPVNLLLSGVIQSVTVSLDVDAALMAHGVGTVPPCPPIPGDLNCDGSVGVPDLLLLLSAWGPCADCAPGMCPADLTGSCSVGVADLLVLLGNWG